MCSFVTQREPAESGRPSNHVWPEVEIGSNDCEPAVQPELWYCGRCVAECRVLDRHAYDPLLVDRRGYDRPLAGLGQRRWINCDVIGQIVELCACLYGGHLRPQRRVCTHDGIKRLSLGPLVERFTHGATHGHSRPRRGINLPNDPSNPPVNEGPRLQGQTIDQLVRGPPLVEVGRAIVNTCQIHTVRMAG